MSQQAVASLVDKWMNDEKFRADIRKDPEGTVKNSGVHLDEEEWKALRAIDWNAPNEQLTARASKSVTCY